MAMTENTEEIAALIGAIRSGIEKLRAAGSHLPAVERNAFRMSGTLRALEIQFTDLLASRNANV